MHLKNVALSIEMLRSLMNHGTVSRVRAKFFHTAFLTADYRNFPDPPYQGRGWSIHFVPPATEFPLGGEVVGNTIYPIKEIVVSTNDELKAARAANLIYSANLLLEGSNFLSSLARGQVPIHEASKEYRSKLEQDESDFILGNRVQMGYIPLACLIAARASLSLHHIYALTKLRLSFEIFSLPSVSLDPRYSHNIPKSSFPEDHV